MAKSSGNISRSVGNRIEDAEGASDTGRRQKKQSICVGVSGFIRGYMAKPSVSVSVTKAKITNYPRGHVSFLALTRGFRSLTSCF